MGHWTSFTYLYVVGGIIFLIPIILGLRKGVLKPKRKIDRLLLGGMFAAYLMYFSLQGVWNYMAIISE